MSSVLVSEKLSLKEQLAKRAEEVGWFEPARDVFEFATLAKKRFEAGAPDEKRQILTALGSNLTLRDRILRIQVEKPFLWLAEGGRSSAWWAKWDSNLLFMAKTSHLFLQPEQKLTSMVAHRMDYKRNYNGCQNQKISNNNFLTEFRERIIGESPLLDGGAPSMGRLAGNRSGLLRQDEDLF
ncbi:MAG: hypothetical protein HY340_02230 [Candidatus Kerfeldbacteria bacterium]|nr:hypothetical protein [Candidatus Kerfeldbacteria bacterium]